MNNKKSYASGVNIGSSSILVTFVLLCLVTFAALSFVSASADNKLAKQTAERTSNYYEANSNAEVILKEIDSTLKEHFRNTATKPEFFDGINNDLFIDCAPDSSIEAVRNDDGDIFLNYGSLYKGNQHLYVSLKVIYPESANDEMFEIVRWESVTEYIEEDPVPGSEESGFLF